MDGEDTTTPDGILLKVEKMEKNRIGRVRTLLPEPEFSENEE